ncbi:MAG: hypothetical protein KBG70_13515 [Chitinophagales bacterium]|jgi:hypothetical protein|nr:hypothetical protein [Chitinophagales bacterium]
MKLSLNVHEVSYVGLEYHPQYGSEMYADVIADIFLPQYHILGVSDELIRQAEELRQRINLIRKPVRIVFKSPLSISGSGNSDMNFSSLETLSRAIKIQTRGIGVISQWFDSFSLLMVNPDKFFLHISYLHIAHPLLRFDYEDYYRFAIERLTEGVTHQNPLDLEPAFLNDDFLHFRMSIYHKHETLIYDPGIDLNRFNRPFDR